MNGDWHLDKKFSVGMIVAIVANIITIGIFVGKTDGRISALERTTYPLSRGLVLETKVEQNALNAERLEERTIKALDDIRAILDRIEQQLREDSYKRAKQGP